mmetsp:Transcript_133620/g.415546  ORF Transcript_133620/g.415546 Transcript_133620/m.415546 type:complete len:302 (+) Transcript_133620:2-907(+)
MGRISTAEGAYIISFFCPTLHSMMADAASLVFYYHGQALRTICNHFVMQVNGLRSASAHARRMGRISTAACKRLQRLHGAYAVVRHISGPSVDALPHSLHVDIEACADAVAEPTSPSTTTLSSGSPLTPCNDQVEHFALDAGDWTLSNGVAQTDVTFGNHDVPLVVCAMVLPAATGPNDVAAPPASLTMDDDYDLVAFPAAAAPEVRFVGPLARPAAPCSASARPVATDVVSSFADHTVDLGLDPLVLTVPAAPDICLFPPPAVAADLEMFDFDCCTRCGDLADDSARRHRDALFVGMASS